MLTEATLKLKRSYSYTRNNPRQIQDLTYFKSDLFQTFDQAARYEGPKIHDKHCKIIIKTVFQWRKSLDCFKVLLEIQLHAVHIMKAS
jgi:hypothetical protein